MLHKGPLIALCAGYTINWDEGHLLPDMGCGTFPDRYYQPVDCAASWRKTYETVH